jgi:hypothetical protein
MEVGTQLRIPAAFLQEIIFKEGRPCIEGVWEQSADETIRTYEGGRRECGEKWIMKSLMIC